MDIDLQAPGGSGKPWDMCRLCFVSHSTLHDTEFRDIRAFEDVLEHFSGSKVTSTRELMVRLPLIHQSPSLQLLQDGYIPQKICSSCEDQIESMKVLRERVNFSNPIWTKYLEQIRESPVAERIQPLHTDVPLNCHLCGQCYSGADLAAHIVSKHGTDHVPHCDFCRVLLSTIETAFG